MPRRKPDATDGPPVPPEDHAPLPRGDAAAPVDPEPAESLGPDAPSPAVAAAEPVSLADPEPAPEEPILDPLPEPALAAPAADEHDEHVEEEGMSLAARALLWLLLVLAGAGIGLWAAPRLAPHLPSGMAPVADWLTPGRADTEARIAELESRLGAEIDHRLGSGLDARLAALPSADQVRSEASAAVADGVAAVTAAQARLETEIAGLRDGLGEVDAAALRQQLARLGSTLDGQSAELAALKAQLSGGAAAVGALSDETAQRIDVYSAELDGLRAEIGTLGDRVGALGDQVAGLSGRLDDVAAEADRQVQAAQSRAEEIQATATTAVGAATVASDLAQVEAALTAGRPYAAALDSIRAADPGLAIPEALAAPAAAGVATMAALRDRFPDAAHAAIRANIMATAGDGFMARTRAFFRSQVASRSLEPRDGVGPDAVLSRIEARLKENDLSGALAEAGNLPSEAEAAMRPWLDAAEARAAAIAALATLQPAGAAPAAPTN